MNAQYEIDVTLMKFKEKDNNDKTYIEMTSLNWNLNITTTYKHLEIQH